MKFILPLLFTLLTCQFLQGCMQAALGVAAELGIAAAQERTVGKAVDDFTIWTKIKNAYIQENVNDLLGGVDVEVIEGVVHLTGQVQSPESRIDAVKLAWKTAGVKEVINEVQVVTKKSVKQVAQDNLIEAQLRSKLLFSKDIKSINYTHETVNGTVYLMGIAQDEGELTKVTDLASKIKGVKRVISHVRMRTDPGRSLN